MGPYKTEIWRGGGYLVTGPTINGVMSYELHMMADDQASALNSAYAAGVASVNSQPQVAALVEAVKLLIHNETKADELSAAGMVDNAHLKALRASAARARTALADFEKGKA